MPSAKHDISCRILTLISYQNGPIVMRILAAVVYRIVNCTECDLCIVIKKQMILHPKLNIYLKVILHEDRVRYQDTMVKETKLK